MAPVTLTARYAQMLTHRFFRLVSEPSSPAPPHIDLSIVPQADPDHSLVLVHYLNTLLSHVPLVTTLLTLIALDIVMGLMAAYVSKRISSSVSFKGMTKKAACVLIVGFAAVIEPLAQGLPLAKIVSFFYIFTESISILEAAAGCGIPLPPGLMATLIKLRDSEKAILPMIPPAAAAVGPSTTIISKGPLYVSSKGKQPPGTAPADDAARTAAIADNTSATRANTDALNQQGGSL